VRVPRQPGAVSFAPALSKPERPFRILRESLTAYHLFGAPTPSHVEMTAPSNPRPREAGLVPCLLSTRPMFARYGRLTSGR
jgi:hypothetical protein